MMKDNETPAASGEENPGLWEPYSIGVQGWGTFYQKSQNLVELCDNDDSVSDSSMQDSDEDSDEDSDDSVESEKGNDHTLVTPREFVFQNDHQLKLYDGFKCITGLQRAEEMALSERDNLTDVDDRILSMSGSRSKTPLAGAVKYAFIQINTVNTSLRNIKLSNAAMSTVDHIDRQLQSSKSKGEHECSALHLIDTFGSHFTTGRAEMGILYEWVILHDSSLSGKKADSLRKEIFKCIEKMKDKLYGQIISGKHLLEQAGSKKANSPNIGSFIVRITIYGSSGQNKTFTEWEKSSKNISNGVIPLTCVDSQIVPVWKLPFFHDKRRLQAIFKKAFDRESTSEDDESGKRARKTLTDYISKLKLDDYGKSRLALESVMSAHRAADPTPVTWKDVPHLLLEQLIMTNYTARDGVYRDIQEDFHPLDIFYAIFQCCDPFLQQLVVNKMFTCKLAIPLLIPVNEVSLCFTLWPLETILLNWRSLSPLESTNEENSISHSELLARHNIRIVSFMRAGKLSVSKSNIANGTISSDTCLHTFYDSEGVHGMNLKYITNGVIEAATYLPSAKPNDIFDQELLFLNLRGNCLYHEKQTKVLQEISMCTVILVDVKKISVIYDIEVIDHASIILLLTHDSSLTKEESQKAEKICKDVFTNCHTVATYTDKSKKSAMAIHQELQALIIKLMKDSDAPATSLTEKIEAMSAKYDIPVDETRIDGCVKTKKEAHLLIKMRKGQVDKFKEEMLPYQRQVWHEIASKYRSLHKAGREKKSPLQDKENVKTEIKKLREKQRSYKISSFIESLLKMIDTHLERSDIVKYFIQWLKLEMDILSRNTLPGLQRTIKDVFLDRNLKSQEKYEKEEEWRLFVKRIVDSSFGLEHVLREFAQIYEAHVDDKHSKWNHLPELAARLLLKGISIEIMDGDAACVPIKWVKAVLNKLIGQMGNKRIFVLSIIGIQSSGKSTLLNTMFGLEILVSAGRCTRGIFAQLIAVKEGKGLPCDFILILDSEGLRAPELSNRQLSHMHDNELATFVIGLADLTIINVKGENATEMHDILSITVHAFLRMKQADRTRQQRCMFVHQNVSAVDAKEGMSCATRNLMENLEKMTDEAKKSQQIIEDIGTLSQVIAFDGKRDVIYLSDLWQGDPPNAPVNPEYSRQVKRLQQGLFQRMVDERPQIVSIESFSDRIEDMWNAVLADNFIFSFRNSLALRAQNKLDAFMVGINHELDKSIAASHDELIKTYIRKCIDISLLEENASIASGKLQSQVATLLEHIIEQIENFFDLDEHRDLLAELRKLRIDAVTERASAAIEKAKKDIMFEHDEHYNALEHIGNIELYKEKLRETAVKEASKFQPFNEEAAEELFGNEWESLIARRRKNITISDVRDKLETYLIQRMKEEKTDVLMHYIFPYLHGQTPLTDLKEIPNNCIQNDDFEDLATFQNIDDMKEGIARKVRGAQEECEKILENLKAHDKERFYLQCNSFVKECFREFSKISNRYHALTSMGKGKFIAHAVLCAVKTFRDEFFKGRPEPPYSDMNYIHEVLKREVIARLRGDSGQDKWLKDHLQLLSEKYYPFKCLHTSEMFADLTNEYTQIVPGNDPLSKQEIKDLVEHLNSAMKDIDRELDQICSEGCLFSPAYATQITQIAYAKLKKHVYVGPGLLSTSDGYFIGLNWEGITKYLLLITRHVITKFEVMNYNYRFKHGLVGKLENSRNELKEMFFIYLRESGNNNAPAKSFYTTLSKDIERIVKRFMTNCVTRKIKKDFHDTKQGHIAEILKSLTGSNFDKYIDYMKNPVSFAADWTTSYVNSLLGGENSFYTRRAHQVIEILIAHVEMSLKYATEVCKENEQKEQRKDIWCELVIKKLKETGELECVEGEAICGIDISFGDIHTDYITDIENFEYLISKRMDEMKDSVNKQFMNRSNTDDTWDGLAPNVNVMKVFWTCRETCPYCGEPCVRMCEEGQVGMEHGCLQHKPLMLNKMNPSVREKCIETCPLLMGSGNSYTCINDINCKCRFKNGEYMLAVKTLFVYHEYKKHTTYFPDWKIVYDETGEGSKYWQWVWCNFKDDIKRYLDQEWKHNIPDSWTHVEKEEAVESLYVGL